MNAKTRTHACSVPDCGTQIPTDRLMCQPHWEMVPTALQWNFESTRRRWLLRKVPHEALRAVQQSATAAVVAVMGGVE